MSDDKPKPVDDLKQGLGLLFRAAKGAVDAAGAALPADKIENVAKDAAKEVGRAFESLGNEIDKVIHPKATNVADAPPQAAAPPQANAQPQPEPPKDDVKYDDGYAPEPPKGPRVG